MQIALLFLGLMGVWLLMPRTGRADGGVADGGIADMASLDAGVDADLEPYAEACLCAATPGAHPPIGLTDVPLLGLDPFKVRNRVLASLPPDVRARLED